MNGVKNKSYRELFLNQSDNVNTSNLLRNYYLNSESLSYYKEINDASTTNINNRLNFRLEYTIDSMNAMVVTTKLTSQFTDYIKNLDGGNYSIVDQLQTSILTTNTTKILATISPAELPTAIDLISQKEPFQLT